MAIKEKIILLSIGTVASVCVVLVTFLVSVYFGNFVAQATFLERKGHVDSQIAVISVQLTNLQNGQNEIKSLLKK